MSSTFPSSPPFVPDVRQDHAAPKLSKPKHSLLNRVWHILLKLPSAEPLLKWRGTFGSMGAADRQSGARRPASCGSVRLAMIVPLAAPSGRPCRQKHHPGSECPPEIAARASAASGGGPSLTCIRHEVHHAHTHTLMKEEV